MPLRQTAAKEVAKYEARTAKATFDDPTTPGNLILVVVSCAGALPVGLVGPAGFTAIRIRGLRDIEVGAWYRQDAPATTSVTVAWVGQTNRSFILRANEYPGVAQSNALDKVSVMTGESDRPMSGSTGNTAQADELVIGILANQYASTTQHGFTGGLARLFESVSPRFWARGSNEDWERSRLTIHERAATTVGSFSLSARLSTVRRWVAIIITFRGGTTGPARMTSFNAPPVLTTGGSATLTAFGPLTSTNAPPVLSIGGSATIFPFDYQFQLGPDRLLVGPGTPYEVVSHDGLYGHAVRTSDEDQARGAGSTRGVDLQAARLVLLKVRVKGSAAVIEGLLADLRRAVKPQRDTDWPMVWRHPGQPARLLRCRAIEVPREVDQLATIVAVQPIALRAADPRHYGAVLRRVTVPVTPAGAGDIVTVAGAINDGDADAHPLIRMVLASTAAEPVTRVELVNISGDVVFDAVLTIPPGAVLIGDMEALATGAPRIPISLDGAPKYNAWSQPKETFFLAPAPDVAAGVNLLYLRTVPEGAPIACDLEYHDCWAG